MSNEVSSKSSGAWKIWLKKIGIFLLKLFFLVYALQFVWRAVKNLCVIFKPDPMGYNAARRRTAALAGETYGVCVHCGGEVHMSATTCRHCGRNPGDRVPSSGGCAALLMLPINLAIAFLLAAPMLQVLALATGEKTDSISLVNRFQEWLHAPAEGADASSAADNENAPQQEETQSSGQSGAASPAAPVVSPDSPAEEPVTPEPAETPSEATSTAPSESTETPGMAEAPVTPPAPVTEQADSSVEVIEPSEEIPHEEPAPVTDERAALEPMIARIADINSNDDTTLLYKKRLLTLLPLIREGADVNVTLPETKGNTALHYACSMGDFEITLWLLENGADPNARTNKGATPLKCAGSRRLRSLLQEYGAR